MAIIESTRQQERRDASTRALLHAAGDLILEGGFAAMTFAAIGERSGYSRSMVTVRFGSKEGLVEELLDQLVRNWSHTTLPRPSDGLSGLATTRAVLDAIHQQIHKQSKGLRVLYALMFEGLGDSGLLRDRFRALHVVIRTDFADRISAGQRDGSITADVDPVVEAAFVVTGMRGIGYQWLLDPDEFDASTSFAHFSGIVIDRLDANTGA